MTKFLLVPVLVLAAAVPAFASNKIILDVEPVGGRDPMVRCLARIIRIAVDQTLTDDDLYGLSGIAFLATVCANNCTCRDFRELAISVEYTMKKMGISFEHFEGNDAAIWDRIKTSIDDGVPVLAWNILGDFADGLMTGYDEEKDLVYGWGTKSAGKEYDTGSLSEWKGGGMYGTIIHRGKKKLVTKELEREQLGLIVRMMRRPAMEGG